MTLFNTYDKEVNYQDMFKKQKQNYNEKVFYKYRDALCDFSDLIGDGCTGLSNMFYLLNTRYLHWLDNDPERAVYEKEIKFRRKFYKLLKLVGPSMLECTQVYENRKNLNDPTSIEADEQIKLPNKPVIFVANHGFHDDVLASVLAANRHPYIIWGSIPLLYNTFNGFASSLVGAVCVNRKNKNSRNASIPKALKVMEYGTDILMFPEGGWNKTSEKLALDLWKGVYTLSCAAQCDVVPITHYVRDMEILDKNNIIHTVVDDPIPLYTMSQDEAMQYLRDNFASWTYKMMEKYGRSTREKELKGFSNSQEKWRAHLSERMKGVDRYDSTIEKCADYRPRHIARPEEVFEPIAKLHPQNITVLNAKMVIEAQRLVIEAKENDFQRLY